MLPAVRNVNRSSGQRLVPSDWSPHFQGSFLPSLLPWTVGKVQGPTRAGVASCLTAAAIRDGGLADKKSWLYIAVRLGYVLIRYLNIAVNPPAVLHLSSPPLGLTFKIFLRRHLKACVKCRETKFQVLFLKYSLPQCTIIWNPGPRFQRILEHRLISPLHLHVFLR